MFLKKWRSGYRDIGRKSCEDENKYWSEIWTSKTSKDLQLPPEAGREAYKSLPSKLQKKPALPTHLFQTSSLQNSKTMNFYYWSPFVCGTWYRSPCKLIHLPWPICQNGYLSPLMFQTLFFPKYIWRAR